MLELHCNVAIVVGNILVNAQSSKHNVDYSLKTKVYSLQAGRLKSNLLYHGNKFIQVVTDVHQKTSLSVPKGEVVD